MSRTHARRWLAAFLVTALATMVMAVAPAAASASGPVACADLVRIPLPEVSGVSAELDTDGEAAGVTGLPEFCRVALTVVPQIGIEVWLPTGRYNRLFMAPGVEHCAGGPGPNRFDMVGELVRWVERGSAPDRIIASTVEDGQVVRTRPLCAYPRISRYDGKGDPNAAASFDCKARLPTEAGAVR